MSFIPLLGSIVALQIHEQQMKEEEQMTPYDSRDLDSWEFKIVRSTLGRFGSPETVRRLCEQEARAGWEMLEKFDDYRIRFKRRIEHRGRDQHLNFDPYRTAMGTGDSSKVFIALGILVAVLGVAILLFSLR